MAALPVVIRCDSSRHMGIGHVSRCGALAGAMRRDGLDPVFLCRPLPGDQRELLRNQDFEMLTLEAETPEEDALAFARVARRREARWMLLDHPELALDYERGLRAQCDAPLAVIDGQFRQHDCDLLLNANIYANRENCAPTVPGHCRILAGYDYFLLREEFHDAGAVAAGAPVGNPRVLITLGGADPDNLTGQLCQGLAEFDAQCDFDIMLGPANIHGAMLADELALLDDARFTLHRDPGELAALLAGCTLCVSAGGVTLGEAAWLGKPVIALVIADNQRRTVDTLAALGAVVEADVKSAPARVADLLADPGRRRQLSGAIGGLVDGHGAARVVAALREVTGTRVAH